MSNKSQSTNYRSHKRQKSSLLNIGYYFSDSSVTNTPQQQHNHQNIPNLPHTVPHPHNHNTSPTIDETNIYDNDDPYNPLTYNFPNSSNQSQHQHQHQGQNQGQGQSSSIPSHNHSQSSNRLSAPPLVGNLSNHISPLKQPLTTSSTAAPTTAITTTNVSSELPPPSTNLSNQNTSSSLAHISNVANNSVSNQNQNQHQNNNSSYNEHSNMTSSHNQQNSIHNSNSASSSSSFFYPSHLQNPIYGSNPALDPPYNLTPSFNNSSHNTNNPNNTNTNTNNNNNNNNHNSNTNNNPLLDSNLYQSFTYPRIPSNQSASTNSQANSQALKHSKNNLSISSHFNLFNLNDSSNISASSSNLGGLPLNNHQNNNSYSSSSIIADPKRYGTSLPSLPPVPPSQSTNNIVNDLVINLVSVDGSNINNYLLSILYKLNFPLPVDDFYNLLYNHDKLNSLLTISIPLKIDKTFVNSSITNSSVEIINHLLNVFKNPNSLGNYFPNLINKENKLMNVNYHELLRTFLAIKILFDILIQLPLNSPDEPQNYTIPRLSIYKTYYIICQKLILQYPSSSNTTNEQQKLILGQSKLGKLIKLVYPNLLIKRLGSRGESKYNYLGVIWNENIVNDEVKDLCDNNELIDLNDVFNGQRKQQQQQHHHQLLQLHSHHHHHSSSNNNNNNTHDHRRRKSSKISITTSRRNKSFDEKNQLETIVSPELSFIQSTSKFPTSSEFTILSDDNKSNSNWFDLIKFKIYNKFNDYNISFITLQDIFLNNDNLLEKDSLLKNLINRLINPLIESNSMSDDEEKEENYNLDLNLYLIIIVELLPYLLLIKSSTEINFLKNLRLNLLYLINNLNNELSNIDNNEIFSHKNSSVFLLILKKLINLNDLLITFIKLIIKDSSMNNSAMAIDIENFFVDSDADKQNYDKSRNSSVSDDVLIRSSSVSSSSATLISGRLEEPYHDPFNMNFKNILSNDLIYTLIGYNFDPTLNNELKSSISMNFINQEINLIDNFFKKDLLSFLIDDNESDSSSSVEIESEIRDDGAKDSLILNKKEANKLNSLINLINTKLLSDNFKSRYPILVYNNYINFILNDLLKYIFLKQQQQQQQQQSQSQQSQESKSSFGNWWVFNSFIQEYLSLLGEIVGLNDLV